MGASNYIFAQARPSEQIADWLGAHVDLFAFLGGAPKFIVCDNLKAAVARPDRFEPGLNRSYLELASFSRNSQIVRASGTRSDRPKPRNRMKDRRSLIRNSVRSSDRLLAA